MLEVHHRHYEKPWGQETRDDLEALCRVCHEGHHHAESKTDNLGHYFKAIDEVVRQQPFDALADVIDGVKELFSRRKLPFDTAKLSRALAVMQDKRLPKPRGIVERPWIVQESGDYAITHGEAVNFLRLLEARVPVRGMAPEPAARNADRWRDEYAVTREGSVVD